MKKLISILVVAAIVACLPIAVSAAEGDYTLHLKMTNAGAEYGEYAKDATIQTKDITITADEFKDGVYELAVPELDGWSCVKDTKTIEFKQSDFEDNELDYELGFLKLMKYTVVCQDKDGKTLDGGFEATDVLGDTFAVEAPVISGMTPDAEAKDITIQADENKNVVTFTYTTGTSTTDTKTDGTKTSAKDSTSSNSPKTGDPLALYGLLGAASLLGGLNLKRKNK